MTQKEKIIVGQRIRSLRKSAGLLQKEVAAECGVKELSVIRWEKGEILPNRTRLEALAAYLNTTVEYLTLESDVPFPETTDENNIQNPTEMSDDDWQAIRHFQQIKEPYRGFIRNVIEYFYKDYRK